jgi:hypothetical protein
MARLPSEQYLIQQADGIVRLFEDYTERQIVAFPAGDGIEVAEALRHIRESRDLGDEDKASACFWAGYFHAHANRPLELAREIFITEDEDTRVVTVTTAGTEVVAFSASDANLTAQAQKRIHDCASLSQPEKDRAHFWSGFFYAQASA